MSERFRRTRIVQAADTDENQHVNNAVWVHFVVELAAAHAESVGWSYAQVRDLGAIWIVRRHEIDYHGQARAGDEIVEETWVESIKGARSIRCAEFSYAGDGATLLSSTTVWAFVDVLTQRPKRLPAEIVSAFGGNPSTSRAR